MSETNGNGTPDSRILSLDSAKRPIGKGGDYITRDQAAQMVAEAIAREIPKVHEWYLNQLPVFVARMIQDALMSYGLIHLRPRWWEVRRRFAEWRAKRKPAEAAA